MSFCLRLHIHFHKLLTQLEHAARALCYCLQINIDAHTVIVVVYCPYHYTVNSPVILKRFDLTSMENVMISKQKKMERIIHKN